MRKTAKKSNKKKQNKAAYALLIILIPAVVYMLSFSSMVYEVPVIEKHMENAGLIGYAKTVNSFVVYYLMSPDDGGVLELEIFSEAEKQHLLDVKKLVHRTFDVLFFCLLWLFGMFYYNHKTAKSRNLSKILLYAGMIAVAIPIVFAVIPFDAFFTLFHSIFFAPGTWTFPANSALIQIYPFSFWKSVAFGFFLRGFVTGWLLIGAGFIVGKK